MATVEYAPLPGERRRDTRRAGAWLALPLLAALDATGGNPPAATAPLRLMAHVEFLAAPEREGRGFGSRGLEAAADYVAAQFARAGLAPGGDAGGYFQAFAAHGGPDGAEHRLRNVVGVLAGSDPRLRSEAVLLTAHYDHLGYGWPNARADAVGRLHPGADDNASGVAVLIETAAGLATGPAPPRTIVFLAFDGEEAGLLGSRHFVRHPTAVPLAGIVGAVNLDTVGRLGSQPLSVLATGSAQEWPLVFDKVSAVTGIATRSIAGAAESSDQQAFIEAGVPAIQLFTSATLDYHRPSDTPDKVDADGLARVAVVAREAINYLAATDGRLTAPARAAAAATTPTARRISLGAIPDFAFAGPGLRLEGVVPGSPAEKAGMRRGDVLTQLGDSAVRDLGHFNELLKQRVPGERVELRWTRGDVTLGGSAELVAR